MTSKYFISLVPADMRIQVPGDRVWIREYIEPQSFPKDIGEDHIKFIAIDEDLFNFIKEMYGCELARDWEHMKCYSLGLS